MLAGGHCGLEGAALRPQVVPTEPGDVVQGEDAPERAQRRVRGGAVFGNVVKYLGECLLAQRAGYSGGSGKRSRISCSVAISARMRRLISPAL